MTRKRWFILAWALVIIGLAGLRLTYPSGNLEAEMDYWQTLIDSVSFYETSLKVNFPKQVDESEWVISNRVIETLQLRPHQFSKEYHFHLGFLLQGENGQWYQLDELLQSFLDYTESALREIEKKNRND